MAQLIAVFAILLVTGVFAAILGGMFVFNLFIKFILSFLREPKR